MRGVCRRIKDTLLLVNDFYALVGMAQNCINP